MSLYPFLDLAHQRARRRKWIGNLFYQFDCRCFPSVPKPTRLLVSVLLHLGFNHQSLNDTPFSIQALLSYVREISKASAEYCPISSIFRITTTSVDNTHIVYASYSPKCYHESGTYPLQLQMRVALAYLRRVSIYEYAQTRDVMWE